MGAVSGGTVCGLAACHTPPPDPVTIHALPGFWPGLALGVLALLVWASTHFKAAEDEE